METKKKLILDVEFYHKNNVKIEDMLKEYYYNLQLGFEGDRFDVMVSNITLGERNVDILEVFDTIYREFAEKLKEIAIDDNLQHELSNVYEKHRKVIKTIKGEL
ncbi:MAG: hypothetical protein ACOC1K_05415 [Nanoarchaeota archaeon]